MKYLITTLVLLTGLSAKAWMCPPGDTQSVCSSSDDLVISGEVQSFCDIAVTPTAKATALDLVTGEANALVATVTESTNLTNATVTVVSANGGFLRNGITASASDIAYQISYGGGGLVAPAETPTVVATITNDGSAVITNTKDVEISFEGRTDLSAGTYTDTLTFTIEAA